MGAHFSKVAMFFVVYLLLVDSSETAVLPAWELNFRKLDQHFYVFLRFLEMLKNMFSPASLFHVFSSFFVFCWRLLGFFWRSFGAFVVSLAFWCHPFGFESARAMFFLFILLNGLPFPC